MKQLLDWFHDNGGQMHPNVDLRAVNSDPNAEIGMFANGIVHRGEAIIATPVHMLITSRVALLSIMEDFDRLRNKSSHPAAVLDRKFLLESLGMVHKEMGLSQYQMWTDREKNYEEDDVLQEKETCALALFLMLNADHESNFFYPYIATLPTGCTMSYCWSTEKLAATFQPDAIEEILETKRTYQAVGQRLGLDTEQFLKYISIVESRSWNDPDLKNAVTLNPVTDMLNHHVDLDPDYGGNFFRTQNMQGTVLYHGGNKPILPGG
eukprot:g68817.t1